MFQDNEKGAPTRSTPIENVTLNETNHSRITEPGVYCQQKTPVAHGATFNPRNFRFALKHYFCDECARPCRLYGENFNDSNTNGSANPLLCLCDTHAAERGWIR
jgi:hypothetical protein